MGLMYFKRYRMEMDLQGRRFPHLHLPDGYSLVSWRPDLIEEHAETKYRSFRTEIDANVFPCLGNHQGCLNLMGEITRKENFIPSATWLVKYEDRELERCEYCGTVQGIRERKGIGAIQNLGITPSHRNQCLGTYLLFQSLEGFRDFGLNRVRLEVTAHNLGAIRLYERLGFAKEKVVYKVAEVAYN